MAHALAPVFLMLIIGQALHSTEECVARLYDVFAPARFLSGLISNDLPTGFLIGNVVLVAFGAGCWAFPIRLRWRSARALAWFWVVLELGNGLVHTAMALSIGGYFPGVLTAPLLVGLALWLLVLLIRGRRGSRSSRMTVISRGRP